MSSKNTILLACALCGCTLAHAKPTCSPFHDAAVFDDEIMQEVAAEFLQRTHGFVEHYDISRSDCDDEIVIVFEGIGKDANVGNHWIFWYIKATGEIRFYGGK